MPPDGSTAVLPRLAGLWRATHPWKAPLLHLAAAWLALIGLFRADWAAMADQWWNISTYNHVLLIPPIVAWLVHQRLAGLARLAPSPWWPGAVLFGGAVLLWVLGAFAGLAIVRQFGAASMLIGAALALLGPRVGAGLAFPLGYLLFLVPFGDELVPALQMITAKITVALVHLSGIPAVIDGVFIDTPAGLFEVAEACSGVKFLIAMIAFGALVAHVCFVSWRRRLLFLAFALAVPILANGVRAWGTVFAAQYVGAEKAAGVDHLIYGWVFFALVIAFTLALAWRWFDRPRDDDMIDAEALNTSALLGRLVAMRLGAIATLAMLAALALGGTAWVRHAEGLEAPLPRQVFLPDVPGWRRVDYAPKAWWEPRAAGAEHRLLGRYADGKGHEVDVFAALYAAQRPGKKAAATGEGALMPDRGWSWHSAGPSVANARSDRLLGASRTERLAETYYRSGSLTTGSAARLSLAVMQDHLLLRARPTMLTILSAEERPGKPAQASLAAFRKSTGPLAPWMDRMAGIR